MTAPLQYQNEQFRTPSPDAHLVIMHHMQAYTSTVGTQTDPEIFYVNGKPARAVQPFRVIPKPKPIETSVDQTEEDEDGSNQTDDQDEQPHTSGWQQAQWSSAEQEPVEQEIEIQGEVELETELEVEEHDDEREEEDDEEEGEEDEQESASPETEMQVPAQQVLHSQETQTELQHLQRQLLLLKEEEQAAEAK